METKLIVGNIGMMFGMAHVEGAMHYGAEIAAICDLNEKNLRAAGEKYNIPVEKQFSDYHDLINNPDINVISVATSGFTLTNTASCIVLYPLGALISLIR